MNSVMKVLNWMSTSPFYLFRSCHIRCDNICSALEELEDKIDELEKLELEEAIQCEEDHKYDLARLYQLFFVTRDYYVSFHAMSSAHHIDPLRSQTAATIPPIPY
jgi:hypothetical protein